MTVEQWLGEDNKIGIDIFNKKYRYNNETFDEWIDRVSGDDLLLKQLILEKKFLFGGRALSNRNVKDDSSSMFNCYSSGFCPDNLVGIMELNTNLAMTYKSQGGQGVSLSKVRPKGTPIGNRYKSDGIIPFLELFNQTTSIISQGGSRKGALLVSLDIRHKEAETFIKIKSDENKINKANLSLEIDDEFMDAVDTYYTTGEIITLHEIMEYGGHKVEYDIIPINLYKSLVENCYDWADPACLFTNRFRNYNLMEFDDSYQIENCNPCGEQPLPKNFSCNLGSLNLSEFVKHAYTEKAEFDNVSFINAIPIAVEALDTLIDENKDRHPLAVQGINSLNYRNIGLGVMGYATCLMKLGILYGSDEAKKFTNTLFDTLFRKALEASIDLARKKGSFPKYKNVVFDSNIIKNHFSAEERDVLKQGGLRNCSLISVAPTGSISTMLGVTGGCEPEFAIRNYNRKTESLNNGQTKEYKLCCNALIEYQTKNNTSDIPSYFISSVDIDWHDRVDIQAIMQNHVDTAISSTVNLPENISIKEVEQLYLYAWKKGLKGITIFRNGCKRSGILTTEKPILKKITSKEFKRGMIEQVPPDLAYRKFKIKSGCGNLYLFIGIDEADGKIYDCFTNTDGVGGCTVNTQANSRLLSACIRGGVPIEYVIEQLNKSGTCPSYQYKRGKGEKVSEGRSCPSSIAYILSKLVKEFKSDKETYQDYDEIEDVNETTEKSSYESLCPECGSKLQYSGGCNICAGDETHSGCGYSKCN